MAEEILWPSQLISVTGLYWIIILCSKKRDQGEDTLNTERQFYIKTFKHKNKVRQGFGKGRNTPLHDVVRL